MIGRQQDGDDGCDQSNPIKRVFFKKRGHALVNRVKGSSRWRMVGGKVGVRGWEEVAVARGPGWLLRSENGCGRRSADLAYKSTCRHRLDGTR